MDSSHLGVAAAVVFRLLAIAAVVGSIIASIGRLRKR